MTIRQFALHLQGQVYDQLSPGDGEGEDDASLYVLCVRFRLHGDVHVESVCLMAVSLMINTL